MADLLIEPCEFWFVWTKTGRVPRFTHHTEVGAEAEADRLATLHPGKKFIVLRAYRKSSIAKRDPLVQAYMDRDGMSEAEAADVANAVRGVLEGAA